MPWRSHRGSTLKWAGTLVCVVCAAVFLFDQWWGAGAYVSRRLDVSTHSGCVFFHDPTGGDPAIPLPAERVVIWALWMQRPPLIWRPWCGITQGTIRVAIPL